MIWVQYLFISSLTTILVYLYVTSGNDKVEITLIEFYSLWGTPFYILTILNFISKGLFKTFQSKVTTIRELILFVQFMAMSFISILWVDYYLGITYPIVDTNWEAYHHSDWVRHVKMYYGSWLLFFLLLSALRFFGIFVLDKLRNQDAPNRS